MSVFVLLYFPFGYSIRSAMTVIALDVMGGDYAPDDIVKGAAWISLDTTIDVILVGDEKKITARLKELKHNPEHLSVYHASQFIRMDESPKEAIEKKPDASILAAARLVKEGKAEALVSAGNTGACIMACAKTFTKIPGIHKAALASVYPTETRRGKKNDPFSLILDVGATINVTANDLVTFAIMGSSYAARISRNPRPRVAILSNGTEEMKGTAEIVDAYRMLKDYKKINFVGNIEGIDIPRGIADVVVCSGFTGNIVLKMLEGVSDTVMELARYAYKTSYLWKFGLMMLRGAISQLKDITDWEQYGGAPLLGFESLFIKAHGRSKARATANAIKVAAKAASSGLIKDISATIKDFSFV